MAAVLVLATAPSTLTAQKATFNLAAGLAVPTSDFGDRNDAGYSLIVGMGFRQLGSPIAARIEGLYNEFDQKFAGGKAHAGGITANAVYDITLSGTGFTPYVIGGIGYYSSKEPPRIGEGDGQTNVGWNLGGGIRFPLTGFSAYVEARYHSISNANVSFAPIVFGLAF
ncbi:MAG: outer membrane protein [bacterium]